jgi:muramidase (phage lysozyme)
MIVTRNERAFMDVVAACEIGPELLKVTDNGYNVLVGSTARRPKIFTSYAKHPRVRDENLKSDAAGRYQFMGRYWEFYKRALKLPDFGPDSQDRWCQQLFRECGALDEIAHGNLSKAVTLCKSRWASFPGAGYGQLERPMEYLAEAWVTGGGRFYTA